MEDQKQTSFTFEIDNFSEKEAVVSSPNFSSGGCEWFVRVCSKGDCTEDHLSLYLNVANPESLRLGWKGRAIYSFVLLNQSNKEVYRIDEFCSLFCAQDSGWGKQNAVSLKKLQEKGFLEKNKLIVKVEVKVVEVVDEGDVTGNEKLDVNGFLVLYSQVDSLSQLFIAHPDFAVNFRPRNQLVKTTYMNILLNLIETLNKPPQSISETEIINARSELIDLTDVGFKLHWLMIKLDEVSLERKKSNGDDTQVQELEEHIKNLNVELDKEKLKSAAKVLSLEQTVSDLKDEVSDLEDEVSDLRDELNKEEDRSYTSAAEVLSLEKTMSDLNDEISDLKDELNKERHKSDTCAAKVLSLGLTVWDLKDELKKEKGKSDTFAARVLLLDQMVCDLKDELNKEKGVVSSWEMLDYA